MSDSESVTNVRLAVRAAMQGGQGTAFAERADVSPDTLWRFIRGESVSDRTLTKLRRALDPEGAGAAADASDSDAPRDPNEDLPGFWLGYLSAAHKMIAQGNAIVAQGNSIIQQANSHLAVMLAAGSRWEHATVVASAPEPDPGERVARPFDFQPAPRPEAPPATRRRRA